MKYVDFVSWCNERACDGAWSPQVAMACVGVMDKICPIYFSWRREKKWQKINKEFKVTEIVKQLDEKRKELAKV